MGSRILVIDDEVDITDALSAGLERHGFTVAAFNDPSVALETFEPGKYDVAILDIRLPKMNGFELYRRLKKTDERLRVCFLTAFDVYRNEFETVFPELKISAFLKKPISIAKLVATLNDMDG